MNIQNLKNNLPHDYKKINNEPTLVHTNFELVLVLAGKNYMF